MIYQDIFLYINVEMMKIYADQLDKAYNTYDGMSALCQ